MAEITDTSVFALSGSASHLLQRALQLAEDRFAVLARASGLTLRQFAVLAAVQSAPGLSQSDLVRATSIDRSTLADMMNRLERRNLVTRTQAVDDARAYAVRLTPAGMAALQASVTHAKAADAAILDLLSAPKQKALVATLNRIARRADEAAERQLRAERKAARRQARREAEARDKAEGVKKKKKRRKRAVASRRAEKQRKAAPKDDAAGAKIEP